MRRPLWRVYVVELLGTFAIVLFAAGVVCVNQLTLPERLEASAPGAAPRHEPGQQPLYDHQPGLTGIALAQGLALAVAMVLTMHVSGGYLNPAVTLMLWVFNRMQSVRAAWLIGAQLVGAVLAGLVLRLTFDDGVLRAARMGTPHLNSLAFGGSTDWSRLFAGCAIEFILTFFLVFAIFGTIRSKDYWRQVDEDGVPTPEPDEPYRMIDARLAALFAGLALTACVLFAFPLTGAATNPARWFGPAVWEWALPRGPAPAPNPFADMFVYIAGPIAAALAAGLLFFKLMPVSPAERAVAADRRARARPAETHVTPKH